MTSDVNIDCNVIYKSVQVFLLFPFLLHDTNNPNHDVLLM